MKLQLDDDTDDEYDFVARCAECDDNIFLENEWTEDESGAYHNECYYMQLEKRQSEAGIPPHSYRVNTAYDNEAYESNYYKNTEWLEGIL